MLVQLQTNGVFGTPSTYASQKNARFSNTKSIIINIKKRWEDTYNSLPKSQQETIDYALESAKSEFRRRNPKLRKWKDVERQLAKSWQVPMSNIHIDETMQRLLNIEWVLHLLNTFLATKVVPIQVYQPDPKVELYLAWDGQHTLVLLWLIATQIYGIDAETLDDVILPVNVYNSSLKPEMRDNFVDLNGAGKKQLDAFDLFEQQVYGVRIDSSQNPNWLDAEKKQQVIESHGLFLTNKKFGDHEEPGAITRMQEVNKMTTDSLGWLCDYLVAVGAQNRPAEEKEMVMMSYFFERCRAARIKVTKQYIHDVAAVAKRHWAADFSPTSKFWIRASIAYNVWHSVHVGVGVARFNKEPNHGYPFLVEQLKKDLPHHTFPENRSSSEFTPDALDLF
jgi:hypothetical protein